MRVLNTRRYGFGRLVRRAVIACSLLIVTLGVLSYCVSPSVSLLPAGSPTWDVWHICLEFDEGTLAFWYEPKPSDRSASDPLAQRAWTLAGVRVCIGKGFDFSAPFWLVAALLLAPVLAPIVVRRAVRARRAKKGRCANCGYNLTGNVSGRCPECGTFVPESVRRRLAQSTESDDGAAPGQPDG
jgi:hypothetical protein